MEFHPLADLFPLLEGEEFDSLCRSIRQNGLREAIYTYQGRILDGRNRYRACLETGTDPKYRPYQGEDPLQFVLDLNLERRHLNESQRAMVAARLANLGEGRPAKTPSIEGVSQTRAADMLNVSVPSVERAAKVQRESPPEVIAAVEKGELAVSAAVELTEIPPEQQREVLTALIEEGGGRLTAARISEAICSLTSGLDPNVITRAIQKAEREAQKRKDRAEGRTAAAVVERAAPNDADRKEVRLGDWWQLGDHLLFCGDTASDAFLKEVNQWPDFAFAFADPPYNVNKAEWDIDFVWEHDWLADHADIVAVTPGSYALADFIRQTQMPFRWPMCCYMVNGMTLGALGFGNWNPVLLYSHLKSLHRNAQDVIKVTIKTSEADNTSHAARKPAELLVSLLQTFTQTGDCVLDPFLGSGTTLLAAEQLGRRCLGGEISPAHCAEMISRWESVTGKTAVRTE